MKTNTTKYIFTLLFTCSCFFSVAQKKQNVYFLKDNGKIVFNKDSAEYIRIIQEPDSGEVNYILKEFYPDGAKKRFGAVSKFEPQLILEGPITEFYKNGKRKSIENFVNNNLIGNTYYFYENGKIKEQGEYQEKIAYDRRSFYKQHYKVLQYADSTGKLFLDENSTGKVDIKDTNGTLLGNYLNGFKDGLWREYEEKDSIIYEENFDHGKFVKGKSIKHNGEITEFDSFATLPEFKGGLPAFNKFFYKNLDYPRDARDKNIQGRVFVHFVVEEDGSLTNIKIIRGIGGGCDEEALRVFKLSPKWIPGLQRGKPVKVPYFIPVQFQLLEDRSPTKEKPFGNTEF